MVLGPREGRTTSKEQYAYIYRYGYSETIDDNNIAICVYIRTETVQVLQLHV